MNSALPRKDEEGLQEASVHRLTKRQCQILNLVSLGHSNREIAVLLNISVRTVEVHRFQLMRKWNVRNVAQLLGRALHLGLLSPRDMRPPVATPAIGRAAQLPINGKSRKLVSARANNSMKKSQRIMRG